ncbi:MAG TPA: anti-sigma F factor antagonist [Thermoanaerobacterales bacterium]|nr:anti-sigma F factor antagonist [Thermoanaerobacterales bacterium]
MASTIKIAGDLMIVNLNGELDHHTSHIVKTQIENIFQNSSIKKILFNFKNVTFMDSSGVGMIIGRYKALQKAGGRVGVSNLNNHTRRIFEMSGLFSIIPCFDNEKDAIEKL